MANSVDPDQILHSVTSNMDPHCFAKALSDTILRVITV